MVQSAEWSKADDLGERNVSGDPSECRKHAANCRRLAKTAPNPVIAADFEELAQRFLKVADDLERAEARVAELREADKKIG